MEIYTWQEDSYAEINTPEDFKAWCHEQLTELHKIGAHEIQKKWEEWLSIDKNNREDDYLNQWKDIPDDEWAIDFNSSWYYHDWYKPDNIQKLQNEGFNSYAERQLANFLADSWEGKTLSSLFGYYNSAIDGCGEDEFKGCMNFYLCNLNDNEDFNEDEYKSAYEARFYW